ncbi:cyclin-like protein [Gorgonomyces haynaldii]|nr:cyclin-like protein [Gorgonomyces haynaldii]
MSLGNNLVSLEQLENSPSVNRGFTFEQELVSRVQLSQLLLDSAILLKLPQVAASTGQVLLQRILFLVSIGTVPVLELIGGLLYLTTKLEECPRKLRNIIGVLQYLFAERSGKPYTPMNPSSEEYHDLRQGILEAETRILGKLAFEVHVEHPHGYLINFLQSLDLIDHPSFPQKAWNYLNDSYRTLVCVLYQAKTIACGIIYLTAFDLGHSLPFQWHLLFDTDEQDCILIAEIISGLYSLKIPSRLPHQYKP